MQEIILDSIKFCKKGRAIDIGCGHGEDSLILAKEGFDVDSLDFGDIFKAIEKVKEITKIGGVNVIVFFVKDEKEIKLIKELYSEWDIKIINEYDYRGKRVFEICVVNKLT